MRKSSQSKKKLSKIQILEKLENDTDFIWSKKYNHNLNEFLEAHSDGVTDKTISKLLKMTPDELDVQFQQILSKLKNEMEKI